MRQVIYSFSYDLDTETADYQALYDAIKKYDSCQCLDSMWLIASEKPIADVEAQLKSVLKEGDRYLLQKFSISEYCGRSYKRYGTWAWVDAHQDPKAEQE